MKSESVDAFELLPELALHGCLELVDLTAQAGVVGPRKFKIGSQARGAGS
ncbi:hypothetical protein [Streptomyces lydicus]